VEIMAAERGLQLSNKGSNLFIPETKSPRRAVVFPALTTTTTSSRYIRRNQSKKTYWSTMIA